MSSRWLTTRKRKRVRAIDPYLGFYPQSDPPSESAQERLPEAASTHRVPNRSGDSIQAQETSSRRAEDASHFSIMRASSSPRQPRPPKRTYAARKRRCVESDDEHAQSQAGETEDVSYWSSSDVPSGRRARTSTAVQHDKPNPNKQPKTQPVRGPFAARLIDKSLATGTRLADDLQAVHDSTVPQLKLGAKPRARPTQTLATFASRRTNRADAPTYAFPPLKLSFNDENASTGRRDVDNHRFPGRQIRLSQLRQPTTKTKAARKQQSPKELVFKPLIFQQVSGSSRRLPTMSNRKEPVAFTAQGVLRLAPVKSTRGFAAKSVPLKTSTIASSSARQRLPMISQASAVPLTRVDGELDDWDTISIPTSDISTPLPGQVLSAYSTSQANPPTHTCTHLPGSSTAASNIDSQPPVSLAQELRSQHVALPTQILVRATPELRDTTSHNAPRRASSSDSSCFVPASIRMPSSPARSDLSTQLNSANASLNHQNLHEEDAVQILVLNSSQILTPETQLSPQWAFSSQAAPAPSSQAEIFVPNSSQVIVAETSFPSSHRPRVLARDDAAITKRPRLFKTIAELRDSVLESIAHKCIRCSPDLLDF
ncbi:hypothetical protein AURDEDRAFT_150686 [Auricularia subglabra TFB-10046 SS5]|nr:hypothetical protein AURDEDRAFT_150686 [Auricularia subglabra TFB-10046 SS5]